MQLTTEQLIELTERINDRIREFDLMAMPRLSRGMVRIAHDVIAELWDEEVAARDTPWPEQIDPIRGDPMMDGYYIGLQRGREEARNLGCEIAPERPPNRDEKLTEEQEPTPEPPPAAYTNGYVDATQVLPSGLPACIHAEDEDAFAAEIAAAGVAAKAAAEAIAQRTLSRAATETLGPEHVTVTPLKPVKPRTLEAVDADSARDAAQEVERHVELQAVIVALREMATDGKMPPIMSWNVGRPDGLPSWEWIQRKHNVRSWRQMAQLCELEYASAYGPGLKREKRGEEVENRPEPSDLSPISSPLSSKNEDDDEMSGSGYKRTPEQLARIREQRRAEKSRRASPSSKPKPGSFVAVADIDPPKPTVTREQVIAEVRRQAMAGHMPTMAFFDGARPAVWPTAAALVLRFQTTWQGLAQEAGLKWDRAPRVSDRELQPAG